MLCRRRTIKRALVWFGPTHGVQFTAFILIGGVVPAYLARYSKRALLVAYLRPRKHPEVPRRYLG